MFLLECFIYKIKNFICSILERSGISDLKLYDSILVPNFSPLKIFNYAVSILIFLDYLFFYSMVIFYFTLFRFHVSFQLLSKDLTSKILVSTVAEKLWVQFEHDV